MSVMSEQEIREIFSDDTYVSSLLALDTAEEVQASLAEKGLDLTTAEIEALLDSLQKYAETGEELSEDDLETVTGGILGSIIGLIITGLVLGSVIGGGAGLISNAIRRRW